jgi:hypothetical protein
MLRLLLYIFVMSKSCQLMLFRRIELSTYRLTRTDVMHHVSTTHQLTNSPIHQFTNSLISYPYRTLIRISTLFRGRSYRTANEQYFCFVGDIGSHSN